MNSPRYRKVLFALVMTLMALSLITFVKGKCGHPETSGPPCTDDYTDGQVPNGYVAADPCKKQNGQQLTCYSVTMSGQSQTITSTPETNVTCGNTGPVVASYAVKQNIYCDGTGTACCAEQSNQPCVLANYGANCNATTGQCYTSYTGPVTGIYTLTGLQNYNICVVGSAPPSQVIQSGRVLATSCN